MNRVGEKCARTETLILKKVEKNDMNEMIKINSTSMTFEKVYASDYSPKDEEFRKANCVILPYEKFREGIDYCFSEYAQEVLQYSKENTDYGISMDIAATDDNFKVIELHSVLLQIGIFIATSFILPSVINLVTNYAYDKIKQLHQKEEDVQIRVTYISVLPDGTSRALSYDGSADKLGEISKNIQMLTDTNRSLPEETSGHNEEL